MKTEDKPMHQLSPRESGLDAETVEDLHAAACKKTYRGVHLDIDLYIGFMFLLWPSLAKPAGIRYYCSLGFCLTIGTRMFFWEGWYLLQIEQSS